MEIKPIKTGADYRAALKEAESLMTAASDTPEGEKLDFLVTPTKPSASRWICQILLRR